MDIFINTDNPASDRSFVAGLNQPQREASPMSFVAGSSYDVNLYFIKSNGTYDPTSGQAGQTVELAIAPISLPQSGTFTLTDGTDTTLPISFGQSGQEVENALNNLNGGTGPNLGTPSLVDVEKVTDTQYAITFRSLGAMSPLTGTSVSLYPESTITGAVSVEGNASQYAQQVIEITRQPAIYEPTWTTITNGFNATVEFNTTRLLQAMVLERGEPFFIEVRYNGTTVAREVVTIEESNMPDSAFSGAAITSLLDLFAANPQSNADFNAQVWANALSSYFGEGDIAGPESSIDGNFIAFDGTTGKLAKDSLVSAASFATAAQGALADTAVQDTTADTLTNKTIVDISNEVHADMTHLHVRATEAISKGQAVKFEGYNVGQASIDVSLADQSTDVAIGIAEDDIALNTNGLIVIAGVLVDTDTSAFTEGAILYVNGTGDLQEAEPTSGNAQPIALCLRSNANNGVLQILADYPKQPASDVRNDSSVSGSKVSDALNTLNADSHTHSNKAVLDATTEAFTTTELNNINYNTANTHTHANKTILDATTANFTTAAALKLDDIEAEATKGGTKQDDSNNSIIPRVDTKSGYVAGNARGNEALDTQIIRDSATQVASGVRSVILGGVRNTASGAQSSIINATDSNTTGSGSVVIGGSANNASGSNDEILGSQDSSTSGIGSTIVGGSNCDNSGNWGIIAGGLNHTVSQPRGSVMGGSGNTVNHVNSAVIGGTNITTDAADTVYVPSLNIGAGFKMPTGATSGYVLTSDANGIGTWAEIEQPVGGASWVYNSSGYNDQIHGDIPDGWRNIAAKTADQLLVIGTSCTSIGSMAFVGHNNTDGGLVIPDSVTSMGTFAFQSYAASGTINGNLYLSKNLTRIEMGVFQLAKFIGELILPAGLTYIGSNGFSSGTYTGDLTIPPLVTELGNNSFYGNASLGPKLTLPESLTTIGSQSFRNCSGITTIDCYTTKTALDVSDSLLGSGVTTIHARATDSTWTAGSGQTIGGKTGITVIKDL